MNWTVAEARRRFSELIRQSRVEAQPVYNRGRLVAAVVDAQEYREFESWRESRNRKSVAQAFDELRRICDEEEYTLVTPQRLDRENPFSEGDHE